MSEGPRARVLRLFSRLNIGGPSVHVILLSAGLRALGYDTRLVVGRESPREGNMLALARGEGRRLRDDGRARARDRAALGPARALRARAPDARRGGPRSSTRTRRRRASSAGSPRALAGVPTVVHTYHGHVLRGYFSPAEDGALPRARGVPRTRGATRSSRSPTSVKRRPRRASASRPRAKIRVIPLGLELAHLAGPLPRGALRREAGIPRGRAARGIVGRLVPIKDVPDASCAAARRVRERAAGRALRARGRRRGARRARAAVPRRSASRGARRTSSAGAATSPRSTATSTWS